MYLINRILTTIRTRYRIILLVLYKKLNIPGPLRNAHKLFQNKSISIDTIFLSDQLGQSHIQKLYPNTELVSISETEIESISLNTSDTKNVMILMYGNNATGIQHISSVTLTDKIEVCAFRFFVFRKGFSYGTDRINEIMRQKRFNLFDIVYSQSGFSQPSFDFVFVRLDGHLEKIFFGRNQS